LNSYNGDGGVVMVVVALVPIVLVTRVVQITTRWWSRSKDGPFLPIFLSFFFWFLLVVANVLLLEDTRQGGKCDKIPLDQFVIEKEPN
jgi:hypothetical protein